ncbi:MULTISPECIES: GMC oxidoreductase [Amycolatopsis]|uniref:Cholesterol oxidase n=1 Tax=Amycolatopsis albidoflavus TaxID=102226 RepID=A0ABW5I9E2_9PSEU
MTDLPPLRKDRTRALVIGSGLTGAIAANRLALAGVQTIVLERGRRWTVDSDGDTFPAFFSPDKRTSWLATSPTFPQSPPALFEKYAGLVDLVKGDNIDIVCGAGVGGTSLVFAGMLMKPDAKLFATIFPAGVDYQRMADEYYPRVAERLGAATVPDDLLEHERYTSSRLFLEHAASSGLEGHRTPVAVDWNIVRDELDGTRTASATVGNHLYGINSGARNSTDRNYLAEAEETGAAEVRPLHVVTEIAAAGGKYVARGRRIDESGAIEELFEITTDALVLAAGSAGTSKLLVRARATGAIPSLNDEVGRHWGNNGNRLFIRVNVPEKTMARQGGPGCTVITEWQRPVPATVEHGPAPVPAEAHLMSVAGMGIPDRLGRWVYEQRQDDVRLRWPYSGDATAQRAIREVLKALTDSTGGMVTDLNAFRNYTWHPLGGAVLGKACDWYGRVVNTPGLYVMDAALVPGHTGCCNPAWTLAALAERCLDEVLDKDPGVLF